MLHYHSSLSPQFGHHYGDATCMYCISMCHMLLMFNMKLTWTEHKILLFDIIVYDKDAAIYHHLRQFVFSLFPIENIFLRYANRCLWIINYNGVGFILKRRNLQKFVVIIVRNFERDFWKENFLMWSWN